MSRTITCVLALLISACAGPGLHDHNTSFINHNVVVGPTKQNGYRGVLLATWANVTESQLNQKASINCSNLGGVKQAPYIVGDNMGVQTYYYSCNGSSSAYAYSPSQYSPTTNSYRNNTDSHDDATCQKYGFAPQTESYANCRLQLDVAKSQMQAQRKQYEAEVAAYNKRKEDERRKRESDYLINLGTRMMGGQDMGSAARDAAGIGPAPTPPQSYSQRIRLPNGQWVTCDPHGPTVYCY